MAKQTYLNTKEDCDWLRETHLKQSNWNNANPIPDFKSFCLFGNEDCPNEILIYKENHPNVDDKPIRAMRCENGGYSFFKI